MLNRFRDLPTRPLAIVLGVVMIAVTIVVLATLRGNDGQPATTERVLSEQPAQPPAAAVAPGQSQAQENSGEPLPPLPETPKAAKRTRSQDHPDETFNRGARAQALRWPALQALPYSRAGVVIDRLDVDPKRPKYLRLLVISELSEPEARKIYDRFLAGINDTGRWYRIAFVTLGRAKELGYTG